MGSRRSSAPGTASIAYDARGHGALATRRRDPDAYGYDDLAGDLRRACSTTAGSSARCWPAPRWARTRCCASRSSTPSASPALVVITPAYDPERPTTRRAWRAGTRSPRACASGGVEGFVEAYGDPRRARALARDGDHGAAPAPGRPRAPRGGGRRAARRAALAPVRHAATTWRAIDGADGRRGRPRRGRPRAPATRSASATRAAIPGARLRRRRSRAARRSPGRAASSRRSSRRSPRGRSC